MNSFFFFLSFFQSYFCLLFRELSQFVFISITLFYLNYNLLCLIFKGQTRIFPAALLSACTPLKSNRLAQFRLQTGWSRFHSICGGTAVKGEIAIRFRRDVIRMAYLLRDVLDPAIRVHKARSRSMRVDPLVVDLRGGIGVPVAVPRHVSGSADIVVAHGFPPDDRLCFTHLLDVLVHTG